MKNGFVRYNGLPRFRHEREKHSRINNPDYLFGGKQQTSAYAEAAILFLEFKDGSNGARKDWLDVFFKEERLPFELGWEVREVSILEVLGTTTAFRILAA